MKHAVALSFLLTCCGVLLGDSRNPGPLPRQPATLLEDLVRMTRAGSSDVTVLAYARAHRLELPPELSDDNLRWLRDSGVGEMVVRYMTAVDVRASDEGAREYVAYDTDEDAHPRAAYSSGSDDDSDRGGYPDSYVGSYADSRYDAYPRYDYDYDYDYGYYPPFGYGYDPYGSYFFVDRGGSFRRFHRQDRRFGGHRGFDEGSGFRGHRGGVAGHDGFRDAWRDRGFRGRRGRSVVVGPRGSGRPGFARGRFGAGPQAPRGRAIGDHGLGRPGSGRGSFPHGFRGPQGGIGRHGDFGHRGLSGGPYTGRGFSRSPIGDSGRGRAAAGTPGGRGRR